MLHRIPQLIRCPLLLILFAVGLPLFMLSCSNGRNNETDKTLFVATIRPVASILEEITGDRAEVYCLLKPGSSPHTYDVTPSDAVKVENARGVFWVHPKVDGWAVSFGNPNKIEVFDLVPPENRREFESEHIHEMETGSGEHDYDPHFWTSPSVTKEIIHGLVQLLSDLDPDGAGIYTTNGKAFITKLENLSSEISEQLKPFEGESVLLFHPSFMYFMDEFGLELAGVIEPFPGKEPTPKYILELMETISERNVKAIFTEPQLPTAAAETISAETGLPVVVIDPIGGYEGRETYFDLIRYNTRQFVDAFSQNG